MVKTRITKCRFTLSPFTSEQMAKIGSIMCDTIRTRIQSSTNAEDQPAKPLVPGRGRNQGRGYPERKSAKGRNPTRDWTWTGITLKSLGVKSANENIVTIGFNNDRSDFIAHANNLKERAFGTSPNDHKALVAAVRATLRQERVVQFRQIA